MKKIQSWAIVLAAGMGVAAAGFPSPVAADQTPPMAPSKRGFDTEAKRNVVDEVVKLMTDEYVLPDVGRQAASTLSRKLAAGDYETVTDPGAFARRLTEDLNAVAHDKHLRVRRDEPGPPRGESRKKPSLSEGGFTRVDVLAQNIGYVDLKGFPPKELFKPVADKAMRLLTGTDALLIDLRSNGGGAPATVAYWVSFFMDPKTPIHVNDLLWRKPGTEDYRRDVFQTEATPSSYLARPVVLLTGPGTFSGGEEFAYDMQSLKRATLVGEATGGGANPGAPRHLPAGLSIFLPTGRAVNPITQTSWEGTGVQPDMPVPAAAAFATAYKAALEAAGKKPLLASAPSGPDAVITRPLLRPRSTAQPGSEAALRRGVAEFQAGAPRYDLLSPQLAELTREQLPEIDADIAALGALQSVTFVEVGPMEESVFEVKFAKGKLHWGILLDGEGKTIMAYFHPE